MNISSSSTGGGTPSRKTLTLDQLRSRTGRELALSGWLVVDQAMIDGFAEVTGDHQFIHVDPVRAAAETPFGGTIAHGMLSLSLIAGVGQSVLPILTGRRMSINYGFDKVRFLEPVKVGSKVRVRYLLDDVVDKGDNRFLISFDASVEAEGSSKPAVVARSISMAFMS